MPARYSSGPGLDLEGCRSGLIFVRPCLSFWIVRMLLSDIVPLKLEGSDRKEGEKEVA